MKTLVPPPVQGLIFAGVMWLFAQHAPVGGITFSGQKILAGILIASGLGIDFVALYKFWQAKTTVTPLKPEKATTLVSDGLYNYSRNPMYLGMLLVLIGWMVWLGQPLNVLPVMAFVWYITTFQIKPEEEILRENFGAEYEAYIKRVRRWL